MQRHLGLNMHSQIADSLFRYHFLLFVLFLHDLFNFFFSFRFISLRFFFSRNWVFMFYIDPPSILLFCRYARQVAAFFEFVKKKKEDPTHKVGQAAKSNQPNLLLPNNGGFWVPNGKHFPGLPLESLDFRRAMPSISG